LAISLFSENNRERLIEEIENKKRGIKNTASGNVALT
jgi:hypothetical protein